ncbi:MAG: APC family permease, partial [Hyphomicrobiales bacterium]
EEAPAGGEPGLKRSIGLALLTFYGLGTTIGAGIYVLVGETAAAAGYYAPLAFVLAGAVMALAAAAFAEFAGRLPVSAGEAAYVASGLSVRWLPTLVGLMVASAGLLTSAVLVQGGAGYLVALTGLPELAFLCSLPFLLGAIAAWGIAESMRMAAILTLIEIAGLVIVIAGGGPAALERLAAPDFALPPLDAAAVSGLLAAGLLAVFAFIGFEDIVNVAEEVHRPERTIPWAIALTLAGSVALYILISGIAVLTVPHGELAGSSAPLALVMEHTSGMTGATVSVIAVAAVLNGVIIQMIMASRVLYGLARLERLPSWLGHVNTRTRTPLRATAATVAVVLMLALTLPLDELARYSSMVVLAVFALVNLALWRLKGREPSPPPGAFLVIPRWVPMAGLLGCCALLLAEAFRRLIA